MADDLHLGKQRDHLNALLAGRCWMRSPQGAVLFGDGADVGDAPALDLEEV